ncbi:hypothetical protein Vadar_002715 [Vaccinium darrowii]|uniref:Uncharacterized protein n=1 Tax=Vaccinium darrowii TaxID=229202 RepID=A0ACB7XMQ4_9ERIC|nr:hypothetical protein Vadar_002715 [Vaccinium darrowii]
MLIDGGDDTGSSTADGGDGSVWRRGIFKKFMVKLEYWDFRKVRNPSIQFMLHEILLKKLKQRRASSTKDKNGVTALEETFCNPASLTLAPAKWQKFTSSLMIVLNTFEAQPYVMKKVIVGSFIADGRSETEKCRLQRSADYISCPSDAQRLYDAFQICGLRYCYL